MLKATVFTTGEAPIQSGSLYTVQEAMQWCLNSAHYEDDVFVIMSNGKVLYRDFCDGNDVRERYAEVFS
jgi:hypothetical protein